VSQLLALLLGDRSFIPSGVVADGGVVEDIALFGESNNLV